MQSAVAYQLSNCALVCGVCFREIISISPVTKATLQSKDIGIESIAATKGRRSRIEGRFYSATQATKTVSA